ncbi:MAG: hypothetical protein VX438_15130, partial [Planctomycetota bacterium]|nr:hypothetical protein [Planctomycetota bacterium]
MYICLLIGLAICQSNSAPESPRIQPLPIQITYQTQRKPVLQDTPPSSFVPPKSSFDPNRLFVPSRKSSASNPVQSNGFQAVEPNAVQPLRSNDRKTSEPSQNSFSIQSVPSGSTAESPVLPKIQSQQRPPTAQPFTVKPAIPSAAATPSRKQFDPPGSSLPEIRSAETVVEPQSNSADTATDPQLKEISELILNSIHRPSGNRLSLSKAVSYANDPTRRKEIVKQYWTCFVSLADQQFAIQEVRLLSSIPTPETRLNQYLMRAALSSAEARMAAAKLAYQKSALVLAKMVPEIEPGQAISFADLPWIGNYRTNSEEFVKSGMFDRQIRNVDQALPALRDLVYQRGVAVYDNLTALRESIGGLEQGTTTLETVLSLHKETRDQRIEFFKATRDYNHAIAN